MDGLVPVKSFGSRVEAGLAKGKLDSNGIASFISADDEGGMLTFALNSKGIQLFVKKTDLEKARKILEK